MFSLSKFEEWFVAFWCVVMPITGLVVLPSVQGTIPAYMCAFGSFFLVLMRMRSGQLDRQTLLYFRSLLLLFLVWLLLLVGSQLTLILSHRHDFGDIGLIQPELEPIVFRPTLFTQSLYFVACVLTAFYFRYFFEQRWMRYVYWGGYFLAGYGIYEWTYYLVFHQVGDFMTNRMFGDHPASWSQSLDFGGIHLLRIKSTLGEPTFFAAVVIPYLYLALDAQKRVLTAMLLFTAIFSISTACYICLGFTLFVTSVWSGRPRVGRVGLIFIVVAFLIAIAVLFPDMFRGMFEDKISGNNESGADRVAGAAAMDQLLGSFNVGNWIFGIGFGYVYSDIYHGLLMNTGLIGLGLFLWIFGRALWQFPVSPGYEGHKAGLLAIMILCGLSLSEMFLPPTWMFIGLAYFRLDQLRRSRAAEVPVDAMPRQSLATVGARARRLIS
jgi:hypothetical protein